MAVDSELRSRNSPVPFCLSHADYVRAYRILRGQVRRRLETLFHTSTVTFSVVDRLYTLIRRIALRTQQLLYRDDAARIRQLYSLMATPMPAELVALLAPLAPY